jgi:hypothetical protein
MQLLNRGTLFASFLSSAAEQESVTLVPAAYTHDIFQPCQTSPQAEIGQMHWEELA